MAWYVEPRYMIIPIPCYCNATVTVVVTSHCAGHCDYAVSQLYPVQCDTGYVTLHVD